MDTFLTAYGVVAIALAAYATRMLVIRQRLRRHVLIARSARRGLDVDGRVGHEDSFQPASVSSRGATGVLTEPETTIVAATTQPCGRHSWDGS